MLDGASKPVVFRVGLSMYSSKYREDDPQKLKTRCVCTYFALASEDQAHIRDPALHTA